VSLDDYSKEQYFHEADRKDSLNTSINFPVGLATLVAGGIALFSKTIRFPLSFAGLVQFNFVAMSSVLLVIACYLLARSYWNYGYGHMPTAAQLVAYMGSLKEYYLSTGLDSVESLRRAEEDTQNYISEQFAKNADINAACNDRKSSFLFKASGFLIASIVPLALASPLHFYRDSSAKEPIKVEIVQPKGDHHDEPRQAGAGASATAASPGPASTTPSGAAAEPHH
jgi:hypothetical protein